MIALSDAVLIMISVAALGAGFANWQNNIEHRQRLENSTQAPEQTVLEQVPARQNTGTEQRVAIPAKSDATASNSAQTPEQTELEQVPARQNTGTEQSVAIPTISAATDTNDVAERNNAQISVTQPTSDAPATLATPTNIDNETLNNRPEKIEVLRYGSHIVQPGDTLSQIAEQHGTSVGILQQINNIEGSLIVIGQTLNYPLATN